MSKRKREEKKGGDLLAFLGESPTGGEGRPAAAPSTPTATKEHIVEEIYSFISSRGSASKDELFKWGRSKGYTTADIMRAVDELSKEGRIKRRLDEEGRLIYTSSK